MDFTSLIPGLLGAGVSLFDNGSDSSLTPEQQAWMRRYREIVQSLHREARSAPLSSSVEQQGLANSSALLSGAQRRNMEGLFGQLSATDLTNPNSANQLRNLAQSNTAQQGSLYSDAYQNALQYRRDLKGRLPEYLSRGFGMASSPGNPGTNSGVESLLPALFQFGQQWGQRGRGQTANAIPGVQTANFTGGSGREQPYWSNSDQTSDFWK